MRPLHPRVVALRAWAAAASTSATSLLVGRWSPHGKWQCRTTWRCPPHKNGQAFQSLRADGQGSGTRNRVSWGRPRVGAWTSRGKLGPSRTRAVEAAVFVGLELLDGQPRNAVLGTHLGISHRKGLVRRNTNGAASGRRWAWDNPLRANN